ncbi:MAG: SPOR domain-containing protein [Bacteroidaceae bacterium]|nr:SPOR domain-containing protein [Bacteroidaceae bacterium]
MKKISVLLLVISSVFAVSSCKSSKDTYKDAYAEARASELAGQGQQSDAVEIAPVLSSTKSGAADDTFRTEKVVLASGAEGSLKAFSVVCGSFSTKSNAENLRSSLIDEGYSAIVVQNSETGMYRVVCASFDTKEEAAASRAQFKSSHPRNSDFQKAWLLYNK